MRAVLTLDVNSSGMAGRLRVANGLSTPSIGSARLAANSSSCAPSSSSKMLRVTPSSLRLEKYPSRVM